MDWTKMGGGEGWTVDSDGRGRYCVTISKYRVPMALSQDGSGTQEVPDWGNADWPSEEEISAAVGCVVCFVDTADGRVDQAIYEATG